MFRRYHGKIRRTNHCYECHLEQVRIRLARFKSRGASHVELETRLKEAARRE